MVSIGLDENFMIAFLLVTIRFGAWLSIAPPFQGSVPARVRGGMALAMGLVLARPVSDGVDLPTADSWGLLSAMVFQVAIGLSLGFATFVMFQAVSSAGGMIDAFSALTSSQLFDPLSGTSVGPVGRFYQTIGITMLFITNGHLLLIAGLIRTFDAAPVSGIDVGRIGSVLTDSFGQFLVAAVQIAAPLLAALFLTEVLLGLATRAAPKLNILVLGFGAKSLVMLLLIGAAIPLIPFFLERLVSDTIDGYASIIGR